MSVVLSHDKRGSREAGHQAVHRASHEAAFQSSPDQARQAPPALSVDRFARSIGQVALFAAFGLIAGIFRVVVLPGLLIAHRDRARRTQAARGWVKWQLRLVTDAAQALRLIELNIAGLESLQPGALIVANHPSLIDALFLLGRIPGAVPIAKRALLANPFIAPAIRAANYVTNDAGHQMIDECVARLRAGETLLVFPEGTRTAPGQPLQFRRGAAQIALRAGRPLVPVTIRVTGTLLAKGGSWYLAPAVRPSFQISVHPAIDIDRFAGEGAGRALAARRLTDHLQKFFTQELTRSGAA